MMLALARIIADSEYNRDKGVVSKNLEEASYLGGSTYPLKELAEHWDGIPVPLKIPMRLVRIKLKHLFHSFRYSLSPEPASVMDLISGDCDRCSQHQAV